MNISTKTILCVDDDSDDRQFIREAIQVTNPAFKVVEAVNGIEALQYLQDVKGTATLPCLIVLDINMPLMDGKQTLDRIKVDPALAKVPVVILSTSSNPVDRVWFKCRGVELVTKPSDLNNLRKVVGNLLLHCA